VTVNDLADEVVDRVNLAASPAARWSKAGPTGGR
jgi:hypothetical protein